MAEPSTALLLAYFASLNGSLFAAQCVVEALVALYLQGSTFGELQLMLKLAVQRSAPEAADEAPVQSPAQPEGVLLTSQEQDVLLSWVALVFLTLEELGVPRGAPPPPPNAAGFGGDPGSGSAADAAAGGEAGMAGGNAYLEGMAGYVRQALERYDEGQTLARVAGLQQLVQQVQQEDVGRISPSLQLMQAYTRLILITVEVVAALGLPTRRTLQPAALTPCTYGQAFADSCLPPPDMMPDDDEAQGTAGARPPAAAVASASAGAACPPRSLAVRLLVSFMGAVIGSPFSLSKFVEGVQVAYSQGLAADELLGQLDDAEFRQTGGLLPVGRPPQSQGGTPPGLLDGPDAGSAPASADSLPPPPPLINKQLFSSWLSITYMALAQLGVPHAAAQRRLGWAWAGFGDATEAIGTDAFVADTLRACMGGARRVLEPSSVPSGASGAAAAAPQGSADQAQASGVEGSSSSGVGNVGQQDGSSLAQPDGGMSLVRVEDDVLPTTSSTMRLIMQQVALVRAAYESVAAERQR